MKNILKISVLLFIVFNLNSQVFSQEGFDQKFNDFWNKSLNELNNTDLKFETIYQENSGSKKIELIKIKSVGGVSFYIWQSTPNEGNGFPVRIRYSGFGEGNTDKAKVPKDSFMSLKNTICIKVDIRGQGLSTDDIKFEGFLTNGIESKDSYIYRGAFLDAVRVVDYASMLEKANSNILVSGGSQGGLLSLVASALNSKVTLCVTNFPFFADIKEYKTTGWPLNLMLSEARKKHLSKEDTMSVLRYFDLINFAKRIKIPVFMSCGSKDNITPYEGALKVFRNINEVNKLIYVVPCEGHGCSSKSALATKIEDVFIKANMISN